MDWPTALSVEGSLTEETEAGRLGQVCEADCMSAETEHKRACVCTCIIPLYSSLARWNRPSEPPAARTFLREGS